MIWYDMIFTEALAQARILTYRIHKSAQAENLLEPSKKSTWAKIFSWESAWLKQSWAILENTGPGDITNEWAKQMRAGYQQVSSHKTHIKTSPIW